MSDKFVLLSDVHLHHTPKWRYDWLENFLKRFTEYYKKEKPNYELIITGDFFESRDRLDGGVMNVALDFINNWRHSPIYWLTGQHDSLNPGYATMRGLHKVRDDIAIIDDDIHFINEYAVLVPYARSLETYRGFLDKVRKLDGYKEMTMFTHMPVFEILRDKIHLDTAKEAGMMSVEEFSDFKHVISGDIHTPPDRIGKNFQYVGMVAPRNWQDKHAIGVYAEYDLATQTLKRVPTKAPEFVVLPNERFETEKDIKFTIRADKHYEVPESRKDDVLGLQRVVEPVSQQKRLTDKEMKSINDERVVLDNFVNKNAGNLNKKSLLQYGYDIVKAAA